MESDLKVIEHTEKDEHKKTTTEDTNCKADVSDVGEKSTIVVENETSCSDVPNISKEVDPAVENESGARISEEKAENNESIESETIPLPLNEVESENMLTDNDVPVPVGIEVDLPIGTGIPETSETQIETSENVAAIPSNSTEQNSDCMESDVSVAPLNEGSTLEEITPAMPIDFPIDTNVSDLPLDHLEDLSTTQVSNVQTSDNTKEDNEVAADTNVTINQSGLGLLAAQYGDDKSDSEDSVVDTTNEYREMVVEIDSDTSSDSDIEEITIQRNDLKKLINLAADDEYDEDDENNGKPRKPPKVKGEFLLEDLPPIQDLQITVPEEECIELGKIFSIVDQLVLVKPYLNAILVNLDTVLFLEKGNKVLGEVFDVLGQVADPIYCIRFNSNKQIKDKEIEIGQLVYAAPKTEHTQYIILSNLMNVRGSDASWENDIEPPNKYLDYSDDEEEREARRSRRNKDRPVDYVDLTKKPRTDSSTNSSGRRPRQSYDRNASRQNNYNNQQGRNLHSGNNYQYPTAGNSWHTSNYCNNNQQYYQPAPEAQYQQMQMPNMVFNPYAIRPPHINPENMMPGPSYPAYLNRPPPPPPQ